MKKAQVKLDQTKDQASTFGRDVQLQCTSSGHYYVPLHEPEIPVRPTFDVLISSSLRRRPNSKRRRIGSAHNGAIPCSLHKLYSRILECNLCRLS